MDLKYSDVGLKKDDIGHGHFFNSTGDKGNFKRQRHETLSFLKIDMRHGDAPSRALELLGAAPKT